MNRDDRREFLKGLTALQEYHRIDPLSEALQLMYLQAFDDYPLDAILQAFQRSVDVHTFFPKVPELKALIDGDKEERADDAWRELHSEIRRVGAWRQPALSPLTQEAMLLVCGSWERCVALIGRADEGPELMGWQKRWRESYGHATGRVLRGELPDRAEARALLDAVPKQLPEADERAVPKMSQGVPVARDVQHQRRRGV